MKQKTRWIIAAALAAAALVAVVVTTSKGPNRASASSAQAPISVLAPGSTAPMATATLDPQLLANIRRVASQMPARGNRLDIDAARQALTSADGTQVIAAPGANGQVCAMLSLTVDTGGPNAQPAAAPTCVAADEFNTRGVSETVGSGSDVWVFGLVPDGVTSVTLTYADDSSATIPVTHNAFALHATKPTKALSFTGPAGPVTVESRSLDG